jgi:hypothetical protein
MAKNSRVVFKMNCVTHYIILYLADGSVEEYDLTDPQIPLPRFRALTNRESGDYVDPACDGSGYESVGKH